MKFNIGDEVKILPGATFLHNGAPVPENALNIKVFIRDVKNDRYVVGRAKTGPLLGELPEQMLKSVWENEINIKPYIVQIAAENCPIYYSPSKNSGIVRRVENSSLFTIVDERAGFGKLLMGAGWVELAKAKKLK